MLTCTVHETSRYGLLCGESYFFTFELYLNADAGADERVK
jgi:hypothetical protein